MTVSPAMRWTLAGLLTILLAYGVVSLPGMIAVWRPALPGVAVLLAWTGLALLALPLSQERTTAICRVAAIATIIGLRIIFAFLSADRVSPGDPNSYLLLAEGLRAGHGLSIYEPFFAADYRALFPPGYPLLFAAWGLVFGFTTASLLVLNTLTDMVTAGLMMALGKRLGNEGAGRAAGFLYLIWPSALFSAPLAQKESLCIMLVVALAVIWPALAERRLSGWQGPVLLGGTAGLLALSQPGWAPIALLFGLVFIRQFGSVGLLRAGMPGALVAVLMMLPWWVRNWMVFHAFVPLTTSGGASLWIGNNPGATGNWMPPRSDLRGLSEMEYGRRAGAIARDWIVANPIAFAKLTLQKFLRAGGIAVFGLTRLDAMKPPLGPVLSAALFPLSYVAHLGMIASGALAVLRTRQATLLLLLLACFAQLLVFGVWFEFGERHREFLTPFLLLLATMAFAPKRV